MRIALVGSIQMPALRPWLNLTSEQDATLPAGLSVGSTPVTQLALGLLKRGHDLLVVSLDPDLDRERVVDGPGLRACLGPYRTAKKTRDLFRRERAYVRDVLRRESPEVAHAHWTYEYALGALDSGLPTLITPRDWAPAILRLRPTPYRVVRTVMNVEALHRGHHFTVTSPYMLARLRRWARGTVELIPNAIGDELFADNGAPRSGGAPRLLAINNGFSRRKNVSTLIEALALVRRESQDCRLRLVGTGFEPGGPAQCWARERKLDEGIDWQPLVPHHEVPALLRSADVFVHPSLEESFGLVLVEAMAQRLPVVGGRASGAVPWVLDEGRAGLLVDVTSAAGLARGLLDLLGDPARRQRLGASGYAHAWRHFRTDQVLDRYVERYAAVLAAKAPRGRNAA